MIEKIIELSKTSGLEFDLLWPTYLGFLEESKKTKPHMDVHEYCNDAYHKLEEFVKVRLDLKQDYWGV